MGYQWIRSALVLLSACGSVKGTPADAPPENDDAMTPEDAPIVQCSPPSTTTCDDATDTLTVCDDTGHGTMTACPLGCHATEERCIDVAPSNNLGAYLDMSGTAPVVDLPDGTQIDTTNGTITTPTGTVTVPSATVQQAGNPTIRVFMVGAITLNDVTVSGTNAFALVSSGLVTIQGQVSATGVAHNAGPGASTCALATGLGGTGVHPGTSNVNFRGGGGGNFGGTAARGGHAGTVLSDGGAAGVTSASPPTLIPLRGGCKGGGSDHPDGNGIINVGGGGGGAVQIVSRTQISIVQNSNGIGGINVGGGGGPAGPNNPTGYTGGGGGGGSGGGVLLEAPTVLVTGTGASVAAGGGGGGGGCANQPGATGRFDATPAAGGSCTGLNTTAGGAGGVSTYNGASLSAGQGVDAAASSEPRQAGGGGGGVGRIRINNATGSFTVGAGAGVYGATTIGTVAER